MTPEELRDVLLSMGVPEASRLAGCSPPAPMTPRELRELLGKVGIMAVCANAECCARTVYHYRDRAEAVPPHIVERLEPLRHFRPITLREIRAIVARAGGMPAVQHALDVSYPTLHAWTSGRVRPTFRFVQALRELWLRCAPARPPRVSRGLVHGVQPMSADEVRRHVQALGGVRFASRIVGCSRGALYSYLRGRTPVAPVISWALSEAAVRHARGDSEGEIASHLRSVAAEQVAPAGRGRDDAGRPLHRSQREVAACVEQLVAVLRTNPGPALAPAEIGRLLGACRKSLEHPLYLALRSGRIVREGRHHYRAAGGDEAVADDGEGLPEPVWRPREPSGGRRARHPDGRPRKRSAEEIEADVNRLVALLRERGPLTQPELRAALDWHPNTAFMTLRHAHRRGVVERFAVDGRVLHRARHAPGLAKCPTEPRDRAVGASS
jgi:hypothetical protein